MNIQQVLPVKVIARKCAYEPPTLRMLGDIAGMTAAGSGIGSENGNPGNCSQDNRRPCR